MKPNYLQLIEDIKTFLVEQDGPCLDENGQHACLYRGYNNTCCGFGGIFPPTIKDEILNNRLNHQSIDVLVSYPKISNFIQEKYGDCDPKILLSIQEQMHDLHDNNETFIEDVLQNYERLKIEFE